jgi:hypothetical protein
MKSGNKKFFDHFLRKSLETVIFWCKHTEAEIFFQNEKINQPFQLDSILNITEKSQTAEIIAGYIIDEMPFYGFYNQGLTLIEGRKKFFRNIQFKIKSRYLEHTLTRDNIREDENYWKVMETLNGIVKSSLPARLFETIEQELLNNETETTLYRSLIPFTLDFFTDPDKLPNGSKDKKIARDTEGNFLTVNSLLKLKDAEDFLYDRRSNDVTRALTKQGITVVKCQQGSALFLVLEKLSSAVKGKPRIQLASVSYFIPKIITTGELPGSAGRIARLVDYINKKMKKKTGSCCFAEFNYPDSCIADRLYVMQNKPGELSKIAELDKTEKRSSSLFSILSSSGTLVINNSHPYILKIQSFAEKDPEMASYFLAKLLYMDNGVETNTDAALASIAIEKAENGSMK